MATGGRLRTSACRGMLAALVAASGTAQARGADDPEASFSAAQHKLHKLHSRAFAAALEQPTPGFDYGRAQAALRDAESDLEDFLATAPVLSPDREQAQHDLGEVHQEQRDLREVAAHVRSLPAEAAAASARTGALPPAAGQLRSAPLASEGSSRRTSGAVLLGAGAVLALTAAVLYGVSVHQLSEAQGTRQAHASDVESLAHHAALERTAAVPLAVLGIAAVGVGIPLVLLGQGEGAAPSAQVELGRAQASLRLSWRLP